MKNFFKVLGIIAITAVIDRHGRRCKNSLAGVFALQKLPALLLAGMLIAIAACGGDDGGSDPGGSDPASKLIKWNQSSKDYDLSLTQLSGSKWTYILSVGSDGYSGGVVTVTGNDYAFKTDSTVYGSSQSFNISIDIEKKEVKTNSAQEIKLIKNGGTSTTFSLPKTDATATIKDTTGGADNPFVGTWKGDGVTVIVSKNLTWSATVPGQYNGSGSYAYIGTDAFVYDSAGKLFGYAWMSSGKMETNTKDGGKITFTK